MSLLQFCEHETVAADDDFYGATCRRGETIKVAELHCEPPHFMQHRLQYYPSFMSLGVAPKIYIEKSL